jgi:hypothetical protein
VNDSTNYYERLDKQIAREKEANRVIAEFIEKHAEDIAIVWKYGDGNGGGLFYQIREKLLENGLIAEQASVKKCYIKKKIHHKIREEVFIRDGHKCIACGSQRNLSVDHIYPESLGGTLELSNLQTLCKPCNSRKGKKFFNVDYQKQANK